MRNDVFDTARMRELTQEQAQAFEVAELFTKLTHLFTPTASRRQGATKVAFETPRGAAQRVAAGWVIGDQTNKHYRPALKLARKLDRRRRGGPRRGPHGQHRVFCYREPSPWDHITDFRSMLFLPMALKAVLADEKLT